MFAGDVLVLPDPVHSDIEERLRAIGIAHTGRYVFVAFTMRRKADGLYFRPISARYMHAKEVAYYERQKEISKSEDG